jgi:hypothetical protein
MAKNDNNVPSKYAVTVSEAMAEMRKTISLGLPYYLAGAPGLGKTAAARALGDELDLPVHEIRVAEFANVDFRGLPVPDLKAKLAIWLPAEIWPTEKCVLVFDEMSQGGDELTSTILKVIRERQIGKLKLHPETVIIATGNRVSDRTGANRLASAVRDSFIMLEVKADLSEWLTWYAADGSYNGTVEAFLRSNPELLHVWNPRADHNQPSPRNWAKAGTLLNLTRNVNVFAGVIGPDVADDFLAFALTHVDLPSVADVIGGKAEAPSDPALMTAWVNALYDAVCGGDHDDAKLCDLMLDLDASFAVEVIHRLRNTDGNIMRRKAYRPLMAEHADAIIAAARN